MKVCLCNPFNDQSLKDYLNKMEKDNQPVRVKDAYKACSGAEKPNCAKCIPMVREFVEEHNEKVTPLIPVKQVECPQPNPALSPA